MSEKIVDYSGLHLPTDPKEAIGQAIGYASRCWTSDNGTGIFDSTEASRICDELCKMFVTPYEKEQLLLDCTWELNCHLNQNQAEAVAAFLLNLFPEFRNETNPPLLRKSFRVIGQYLVGLLDDKTFAEVFPMDNLLAMRLLKVLPILNHAVLNV